MITCTVENKIKDLTKINDKYVIPINITNNNKLYKNIIELLYIKKSKKELNNINIVRMIENYFLEMACVIYDCYFLLKKGGKFIMVNDNVRYAGISISVDLILSEIARQIGFTVEKISLLPQKKGNSSQQMGEHGKESLRKCVYIWSKK